MLLYAIICVLITVTAVTLWQKQKTPAFTHDGEKKELASDNVRSLDYALVSQDKSIMIVYGSQTGTAEEYARRVAKNLYEDYSISAAVADIEDFDASSLNEVAINNSKTARRVLVCFILATYGDGEPTDSSASFYQDLSTIEAEDGEGDLALRHLHYIAFGLGNNTYEKFNFMIRSFDEHLQRLGATRLGVRGEGDDGLGTLDEDFLAWKDETLTEVGSHLRAKKGNKHFTSPYEVVERPDLTVDPNELFLRRKQNDSRLETSGLATGPFKSKNSYLAPLVHSKQLFALDCNRDCLHIEFDVSGTDLSYETGDHLGVWPTNPEAEVQRMLMILGLSEKADTVITISEKQNSGAQVFNTEPRTYNTILRYELDICGKVSREICGALSQMAPNAEVKEHMVQLAADRDLFHSTVTSWCSNLAQFLETASNGLPWSSVPFSFLLGCLAPLQPRYYSISSSSQASPGIIHITVAVKDELLGETNSNRFLGLTTNYLRALTIANDANRGTCTNRTLLPRSRIQDLTVRAEIHIRHSHFRLPPSSYTPIIMIGPGTGVAPFRAFMQDRLFAKNQSQRLGTSILFTGCRNRSEDFIYAEEWDDFKTALGDDFQIHTAFSREGTEKVYVQHRMMEVKEQLFDLIHNKNAWVYICGDAAHMAKDVYTALVDIVALGKSIAKKDAVNYMATLKDNGRIHVSNLVK
ncbi:hypothetical protein V496_02593 [Pseudogymnoascus sp. VKM F-4515 (FW-2607)]|nr:hypothetical protein V496_02593 [Pseudogymnoascus sp. VKM F-4515 (FW-2607)]